MEQSGYLPIPKGFSTRSIHVGQNPEKWDSMSIVPPIVLSSTFQQDSPAEFKEYEYGRFGNPSRNVLEECLASLDGAKYGLCFASGLGSTSALLTMFKTGDHIISADDIYGGTSKLLKEFGTRFGLEISFVDGEKVENIEKAIKQNTKLVWIESPTNPTLKIMDINAISVITKKHNLILAVDNTFLTPYFQRPLELGADLSCYSLTKYMNGHADAIMGAIMTNNKELNDRLRYSQGCMGIVPAPFDCALILRSVKTLSIRMDKHSSNALELAKFLETHPKILKVLHPGLSSHPQHDLNKKQTSGCSGMISIYLKGELKHSKKFLSSLKIFKLAHSLGGCGSLVALPTLMSHASVPEQQRKALNITDNLIRLSIGLEDVEDLIKDLNQAIDAAI